MLGKASPGQGWVSWAEAAEIVGCPVPTIERHVRLGRIARRPRSGRRPTLSRESVEDFATWWRDRNRPHADDGRARGSGSVDASDPGSGWLRTAQAAERLGVSEGHVGWLAQQGRLPTHKLDGRLWLPETAVERLARERAEWVSQIAAARIVGCSPPTIQNAVRRGEIDSRDGPRSRPSLRLASVEEFAQRRRRRRRSADAARRRRAKREQERVAPPDQDSVWLDCPTVALALGISESRVRQLARAERLSFVVKNGRYWFRREHIEQVVAARAFQRRREAGLP